MLSPSVGAAPASAPTETAADGVPSRVRVMSWNLDGLDTDSLDARSRAAAAAVLAESPTVLLLQEVVAASQTILEGLLSHHYVLLFAPQVHYYVGVGLRRERCHLEQHQVRPFASSQMGRALLCVSARVADVPMLLMSAHLESTRDGQTERRRQLQAGFGLMEAAAADGRSALLGGDLNLRDADIDAVGLPRGTVDLWQATGSRREALYTWDTMRNGNAGRYMTGRGKPRLRFDRFYLRGARTTATQLLPVYFELAGLERVPNSTRFVSDHWAIVAHFNITGQDASSASIE